MISHVASAVARNVVRADVPLTVALLKVPDVGTANDALRSVDADALVLLLALDAAAVSDEALVELVRSQLYRVSYVGTWGPGCEAVHDLVDEVLLLAAIAEDGDQPLDILTSWHEHESLAEAAYFFRDVAWPSDWQHGHVVSLAVCVDHPEWASQLRHLLADPHLGDRGAD